MHNNGCNCQKPERIAFKAMLMNGSGSCLCKIYSIRSEVADLVNVEIPQIQALGVVAENAFQDVAAMLH